MNKKRIVKPDITYVSCTLEESIFFFFFPNNYTVLPYLLTCRERKLRIDSVEEDLSVRLDVKHLKGKRTNYALAYCMCMSVSQSDWTTSTLVPTSISPNAPHPYIIHYVVENLESSIEELIAN